MAALHLHPLQIIPPYALEIFTVLHSFHVLTIAKREGLPRVSNHSHYPILPDKFEEIKEIIQSIATSKVEKDEFILRYHVTENTMENCSFYFYGQFLNDTKLFLIVSKFYFPNFIRSIYQQIEKQQVNDNLTMLMIFCELPIHSLHQGTYQFSLQPQTQPLTFSFGPTGAIRNSDQDAVILEVFSPWMLVKAWESLILGKRVIILSDDQALLSPCLEFLRELIKPMIYEGYFHHCCTNETKANHMQTTPLIGYITSQYQRVMDIDNEIMIMNLDTKKIQFHLPTDKTKQTFLTAPPLLLERIHQRIIKIYQKKAECLNKFIINQSVSPFRCIIQELLKFFVKLNTSLMCAQYCSNEDFYLSSAKCSLIPPELHQVASDITGPTASPAILEIFVITDRWKSDLFTDTGIGVVNGCLIDYQLKYWGDIQTTKEWSKSSSSMEAKIMTLHEDYHPPYSVYCECDPFKLLVYEYADQLPVQSIIIASIDVVRPTQYPEYGFEIAIRSGKIFKFSTPNIRVRDVWIEFISRRVHECIYGHLPSYMHVKEMVKTPCKLSEQCCDEKEDKSKASPKGSFVEHGDWLIISDNNDLEKSKKIWCHYHEFRTEIFRTGRFAMFNLRTQGSAINVCDILDESSELLSKMKSSRVCKGNLANYSSFAMPLIRRNEEDEQDDVISDNDSDTTFTGDSESNRSKSELAERPSFVTLSDEADDFRLRAVYHNLSNLLSKQMYQDHLKALISMHQHDSSLVITFNLSNIIKSSLSCAASSNSKNGGNNNLQLLCEYVEAVVPTLSSAEIKQGIQHLLLNELYNQEETGIPRCILRTLLGIIYYQRKEYLEAIQYFAQDNLISPKIISECILNHLRNELQRNDRIFSEIHFINQMMIASPTFGTHSYLLLLEMILGNTTVTPYRSQNILAFKSTKSVANSVNDGILNDFIDTDRLREHPIKYTYNLIQWVIKNWAEVTNVTNSFFNIFEQMTCQLKEVRLDQLRSNEEKLVFFVNVYNLLTVHAIIRDGNNIIRNAHDRLRFLQKNKYCIDKKVFSLADIEFGILRNKSCLPKCYEKITNLKFSENDPRKKYALTKPYQNLSFVLFTATIHSPPLIGFEEHEYSHVILQNFAFTYLDQRVRWKPPPARSLLRGSGKYQVIFPPLIQEYLKDFGSHFPTYFTLQSPEGSRDQLLQFFNNSTYSISSEIKWNFVFPLTPNGTLTDSASFVHSLPMM